MVKQLTSGATWRTCANGGTCVINLPRRLRVDAQTPPFNHEHFESHGCSGCAERERCSQELHRQYYHPTPGQTATPHRLRLRWIYPGTIGATRSGRIAGGGVMPARTRNWAAATIHRSNRDPAFLSTGDPQGWQRSFCTVSHHRHPLCRSHSSLRQWTGRGAECALYFLRLAA